MTLLVHQLFFILTNALFCKTENNKDDAIPNLRIIGGSEISIVRAPYIASLQKYKGSYSTHICGAVIITNKYLLTAGHCVTDSDKKQCTISQPKKHVVKYGSSYAELGTHTGVQNFFVHPDFDPIRLVNDFGAIAVKEELAFSKKAQPAKLPEGNIEISSALLKEYTKDRKLCYVYGWGVTKARSLTALMGVGLHLIETDVCQTILTKKYMGRIYGDIQLCTLEERLEKDACQGDSGGPLTCDGVIWGLVSWGEGCAKPGYPAIFARADVAKQWLEEDVYHLPLDNSIRQIISDRKNIIFLILNTCLILRITEYLSE